MTVASTIGASRTRIRPSTSVPTQSTARMPTTLHATIPARVTTSLS